jgi:hypothetical protein
MILTAATTNDAACKIHKSMISATSRKSRYGSKNRDLSGRIDLYFCR